MKTKIGWLAPLLAVAAFVATAHPSNNAATPKKLQGLISDFSPPNTSPAGPYLVTGPWSLQWQPSGKADFEASLTMVRRDGTDEATRNFHTHHVVVHDGEVTRETNPSTGVETIVITPQENVTSTLITSNGGVPQVLAAGTVRIEITGGTALAPTNIKLIFNGSASAHFTTEPYDGVVLLN